MCNGGGRGDRMPTRVKGGTAVVYLSSLTSDQIIENTLSDVDFVDHVTGKVRDAVVGSYVDGLWWSHGKPLPSL